jgi:hypothetical protein
MDLASRTRFDQVTPEVRQRMGLCLEIFESFCHPMGAIP